MKASDVNVLHSQLQTRAEVHHFRLNQHFPKRVQKCELEMGDDARPMLRVFFTNGHVVEKPEAESKSADFLALCGMLYDLPPKG